MSIILTRPVMKCPSPFKIAKRDEQGNSFNLITQSFGENLAPFYKQLGMLGHNGVDLIAPMGTEIYAAHDGRITKTYDNTNSSKTIGYGVWITHSEGWQTVYFHLQDVLVKVGDYIKVGDLIGHADNTGQYTTGSHLHFGLYPANPDKSNGYDGAIDPIKYFSIEEIMGIIQNNMIVDRTLLNKIYQATFKREPDPEADFYIGREVGDVLDILINSKENKYYSEVYRAVKKIEKELK